MSISTASVRTLNGSRYLQQLCKHWAHRFAVTFDPSHGSIDFGGGMTVSVDADEQTLTATISSQLEAELDRLEPVVEDHLRRFAFREDLDFQWSRTA